jgi:cobalamin biosynthesis protein CobD/CbiB
MIKKIISWASKLFQDEHGIPSSKRFAGILCTLTLCAATIINSFYPNINPSATLVDAVTLITVGALGFTSVDKIWGKPKTTKEDGQNE